MGMMFTLWIKRQNEEPESMPWDDGSKRRFKFDEFEIHLLETDHVVWRSTTAFTLEPTE